MASANFLEEALNTEVDESAVSALVGSLESQLVSATTCHDGPPASNAEVEKSSANMTVGSLEQQLARTTASSCEGSPAVAAVNGSSDNSRTTPINQDSVHSSAASPAPAAGIVNQVTSSGVNQSNVLNSRGGTLRIVCPQGNVPNSGIAVQQGSLLANGGLGLLPCVQGGSDHNRAPGTIILMKAGGNQTDSTVPMTMILTGTYVNTTVGTTTTVTGSSVNTAVPTTTVSSMASGNVQLINKVSGSSMPSMVMIAKPVTSQLMCKGTGNQPSNVQLLNKGAAPSNMAKPITSSSNMIMPSNVQLVNAAVASTTMPPIPGFVTLSSASTSHTNTMIPTNVQLVNSDAATTTMPSMVMIAKPVTTTGMSPGYALIPASVQQPYNPTVAASTSMSGMVTLNKPITSSTISPGYTILPSNVQSSYNASTPVSMGKPITSTGISPGYAIIPGSMSQSFNASVTTNTETTAGISSGYTIISSNAAQQPFNTNVVTTSTLAKSVTTPNVSTGNSSVPVYNTGIVTTSDAASSSKPTATTTGVTPRTTYAPTVLQLVNVKGVPSGVGAQKNMPSRVIIGGQPGAITLQTLANLPPGHFLMRTESGGHILRIGTAPTVPTTTTTSTVPTVQTTQRPPTTSHKEKCQKFLSNLLELSSREPPNVQRDVRTLIQDLIDAKLEPEEFCERLERLLNASPQPCLTGFLRKNLPHLRQSLATGELVIQGIRPPNLLETLLRQQGVTSAHIIAAAPTVTSTQSNDGLVIPHTTRETSLPTQPAIVTTAVVRAPFPVKQEFGALSSSAPAGEKGPFHIKQEFSPATPTLPAVVRPPFQIKQEVIPNSALSSAVKVVTQSKQTNVALASAPVDSSGLSRITIATKPLFLQSSMPKPAPKIKEKKSFSSMRYAAEDDINDVAAMGGVNLAEEAQRILGSTEYVGTQIRSCKDELFLHLMPLQQKIKQICAKSGLEEPSVEVAHLISHACQERLKTLLEKVSTVAEHRIEVIKEDPQYEIYHDVKGQLKFLEELDRIEMKRHEEQEREFLLRAAKSRSKTEDPEYSRLKAKAKEMQRAEMEELRQRDANQTALQAIGPRKKLKLDTEAEGSSSNGIVSRQQMRFRPRIRRITMHDLVFVLRHETPPCNSTRLLLATLQC